MTRRISNADVERRLRSEAPDEPSLSPAFAPRLQQRLSETRPAARPARARLPLRPLIATGAVAACAAAAVLAVILIPSAPPAPPPERATGFAGSGRDAARAFAAAVGALPRQPEAMASTMSRGQAQLTDEARRLLADARQLTSPLIAPWREALPAQQ